MKAKFRTMLFCVAIISLQTCFGQMPPKFLEGYQYTTKQMIDDDGTPFTVYTIADNEFIDFKKSVMKYRKCHAAVGKDGLLFVSRFIEGYEVMSARGFNFKRFYITEL